MNNATPSLGTLLTPPIGALRAFALLAACVAAGAILVVAGFPIWGGSVVALALISVPAVRTWRTVGERYGVPLMVLSVLLYLQGFHTVEHSVQWVQFHLLNMPPRQATGLLSGINVEVVHFVWNWSVLLVALYLVRAGLRSGPGNFWAWLFLAWTLAHTLEHTFLMYQYLSKVQMLWATGGSLSFAEGLPGVLGRGGVLATNADTNALAGFICQLAPGQALTPRLDVHFYWNVGETALMLAFAIGATHKKAAPMTMSAAGKVLRG